MSEHDTSLVVANEQQTAVTQPSQTRSRFTAEQLEQSAIENAASLPSLSEAKKHFMSLETEYWTPEKEGEEKLCWVFGILPQEMTDMETGEAKHVECVMLVERQEDTVKRFICASKMLVASIKSAINSGIIVPASTLTPISIVYKGEVKNKSNAKKSKRWQITPLVMG